MVEIRTASSPTEFCDYAGEISEQGQGLVRFSVSMPEDYLTTRAEALNGDIDARMVLEPWMALRQKLQALSRGSRIPCVCCARSLQARRFAFCLVAPMDDASRTIPTMSFGLCERCTPDRDAAHQAALRGIDAVWPNMRPIVVNPNAGHA